MPTSFPRLALPSGDLPFVLGSGDERTAKDNLEFIRQWLKLYPHLANNPLWIAGESYAGGLQLHGVPRGPLLRQHL